ncbi:MAG TPA: nitroreductase family protein, partial [Nannocystis sp.]
TGLGDAPGLHHYSPLLHGLERRADLTPALWSALTTGLPQPCLLVGLTTIAWREAWKYGERAFRYCQHDLGHAIAAVDIAAAMFGWRALELPRPGDAELATLLGLRRDSGPEPEVPEALLVLVPASSDVSAIGEWTLAADALAELARLPLRGVANRLSEAHQPWPVIDEVTRATHRTAAAVPDQRSPARPPVILPERETPPASTVIRGRRSAVAMDGRTGITRAGFYDMCRRTAHDAPPLRALAGPARIDLAIFVHRVEGLDPGLYLLRRGTTRGERWRLAGDPEFTWTRPEGCPEDLDLSLLRIGDGRQLAAAISCGQDIAADGCFALAMLADMQVLAAAPWLYRRLYWEAGAIGQILYLEAEALGIAATGIGCFFDDRMHALLGLRDGEFQSLYHFTVGGRVDDTRLRTLDPYEHLDR